MCECTPADSLAVSYELALFLVYLFLCRDEAQDVIQFTLRTMPELYGL